MDPKKYLLHHKHCSSNFSNKWVELTYTHSQIVFKIAQQIWKYKRLRDQIKIEELEEACLLHDIGVYSCFDSEFNNNPLKPAYICHGQVGYKILKQENFSEKIARVALTHTGYGITIKKIEQENLPLEKIDMTPQDTLEELVSWADKFHSKWPKFNSLSDIKKSLEKYYTKDDNKFEKYINKFGIPNTKKLEEKYKDWHKEMNNFIDSISQN